MELTGGQALAQQLIIEGVTDIFGIPGVQLDWAVEALREHADRIAFRVPRHEQATSYMADGYARTTGREGVCMVVPGPGMLNALAGLSTAYACNSPVLCISGQILSNRIGGGLGMLHEIKDQSGILAGLTKWQALAQSPQEIPAIVHRAFAELRSGRPRPVAIEIPPDVLQAKTRIELVAGAAERVRAAPDAAQIDAAAGLLRGASFPVIFVGGGALASDASETLRGLAERLQAPVVMSDNARGAISSRHALALTSLGGRAVLPHADVVLVAGSRFVDALGNPLHAAPGCRFIYLNLEAADMGAPRADGIAIHADLQAGLAALDGALEGYRAASRTAEIAAVQAWCATQLAQLRPQIEYLEAIRAALPDDGILVSELTQVGYPAGVAFPVYQPRSFLTPGYQGTLGYGFPTALGAALGNPDRAVVSISGDGGFGWNIQELATAAKYRPNLAIVVFADGRFGNVQRIQKQTFGHTFAVELTNPDFQLLARAFGLSSVAVDSPAGLQGALREALAAGGPSVIEVRVGEMPTPWHLIHKFVRPATPPPANPLGEAG